MSESKLYQSHPSMFRNRPFLFLLLVGLLLGSVVARIACTPTAVGNVLLYLAMAVGALTLLVWWFRCLGQTLIVTDQRVTLRTGLLSKNTNDLYHTDVRNVRVNQSFWQRVLSVGEIAISSAGTGEMEIVVVGLPKPEKIKEIIDAHRRSGHSSAD
ncbi:MAG: PH domain-containing protein [Phycisphaerales bacterium]|jgi:uncharacterized membrane protein YdbT with pleckstrin-like domain|nr:PH domain-containing protein [Phycisphaerales bacterium]MBT7171500.1 PH domain-containing protein [Phycisphaerales bacterium]